MHEVEAQAIGRHERAALRDVVAEHLAQRLVQKMRRRVVGADGRAAFAIDFQIDCLAVLEAAALDGAEVHEQPASLLLRVGDAEQRALGALDDALVADLAAGLAIERRLVDDDRRLIARLQRLGFLAALHQRDDLARRALRVVAEELGGAGLLLDLEPDALGRGLAGALPGFARFGLLPLHRGVEALGVDGDAARAQRVLGEVERETVGVVELERRLAGEHVALLQLAGRLAEQAEPLLQRLLEARLFQVQRLGDQRLGALQLVIGVAHLVHQRRHEAVHQRLLGAEQMRVAHGAAHDAAEHVAAPFVRRQHAVGDEEARRAQVIGDDAVRSLVVARRRHARRLHGSGDQRLEQVDIVVVVHALQHGGDALEAHAGVD